MSLEEGQSVLSSFYKFSSRIDTVDIGYEGRSDALQTLKVIVLVGQTADASSSVEKWLCSRTGGTGQDSVADITCHVDDGEAGDVHVAMSSV